MNTSLHLSKFIFLSLLAVAAFAPALPASGDDGLGLKTVVIDAGHGGHDPGCVSKDGRVQEKNINLDIARKLGAKISAAYPDVKVIYTRSTDVFIHLNTRADIANRNNANLFISIHTNASPLAQPHGFSVHILGNDRFSSNMDVCRRENSVILLEDDYSTNYQGFDPNDPESFIFFNLMQNAFYEQSLSFAAEAEKQMRKGPVGYSRGISQDPFLVLWKTTMPAALVEVGFISNQSDLKILSSAAERTEIAQRLFDAFKSFKAKYDASLDYSSAPPSAAAEPVSRSTIVQPVQDGYGVQIFAIGKKIAADDPSLKGYSAVAVKSGNVFKYVITERSAEDARKLARRIRKEFPGSFPVRISEGKVSALK